MNNYGFVTKVKTDEFGETVEELIYIQPDDDFKIHVLSSIALEIFSPKTCSAVLKKEIVEWGGIDHIVNCLILDGDFAFTHSYDALIAIGNLDWGNSRKKIVDGFENGFYGFIADIEKADELKKKWRM